MNGDAKNPRTLYLCYFGLREPLVQTQVLPYLREIRKGGTDVAILTFEPEPDASAFAAEKAKLAAEGIEWHWLKYHKRPSAPATAFDVFCGAWFAWRYVRRTGARVLHARSHVPAMMAALAKRLPGGGGARMLFDIRGFFPEEYTDAGVWPKDGALYRIVKRLERWLLRRADGFVVLTEKAREILFPESAPEGIDGRGRPVEVIPCCVNIDRFAGVDDELRRAARADLGIGERLAIVYVGSFGGFYMTDETAAFYAAARKRRPDAFALILTQSDPAKIRPQLEAAGYGDGDMLIRKVAPAEIPKYLGAADFALSFIMPSYSKLASSPTKNAEYLACGLPVIVNDRVGDTAELTRADDTGIVITEFTDAAYDAALDEALKMLGNRAEAAARCRASARKRFDLNGVGGERYRRLYRRLLEMKS